MLLTDLIIILGYPVVLFIIGFVIELRFGNTEPLISVPPWVRTLVGALALGAPWLLYFNGHLSGLAVPADTFAPLTLAVALWIGADRVVGVTARGSGACRSRMADD